MPNEQEEQLDLPPALVDALRAAYGRRPEIPSGVDDAILSAARDQFARRRRMRMAIRWGAAAATGLAAVLALVVFLHRPLHPSRPIARGDINADGQLNMVDALALARRLAAHDRLDSKWDINGDGVIDQKDVDAIANASVSLKQTGLARARLPGLNDLGIGRAHAGLASASGIAGQARAVSLAEASPTRTSEGRR
ncbi:MAG TPA: dockerin type I domain-containing protein [Tepidisphaeraceae bacterium]|jgi:hypothetical protein